MAKKPERTTNHKNAIQQSVSLFVARARCLSAGLRYLKLTRLPRHDRGPVPGGNRSAASCLCTVLRRALNHYATRSPIQQSVSQDATKAQCENRGSPQPGASRSQSASRAGNKLTDWTLIGHNPEASNDTAMWQKER